MRQVTLREHEIATVAEEAAPNGFSFGDVAGLERAQRAVGCEAFGWAGRNRIRAGHFVGMIAGDGARLEILPKIDGLDGGATRLSLMRMLCAALDIDVADGELTGHSVQSRDLLELLISLFAGRLVEQVRLGLVHDYRRRDEELATLRGKLDVVTQFRRLAATPNRLACVYDDFTADTELNRLLLTAVLTLRRRSMLSRNQRLLSEIASHFEDVTPVAVPAALSATISVERRTRRWRVVEQLARLLLSAMYQTAHGGAHTGVALLFDMNVLFERYVAAVARRALPPLGFEVTVQRPRRSLAATPLGQPAFITMPDLHLQQGDDVYVLDTKWKRIDPRKSNHDVAQADAYQMHGYAAVYDARATILLYPFMRDLMPAAGRLAEWTFSNRMAMLRVAAVDVASREGTERGLVAAIGAEKIAT